MFIYFLISYKFLIRYLIEIKMYTYINIHRNKYIYIYKYTFIHNINIKIRKHHPEMSDETTLKKTRTPGCNTKLCSRENGNLF